MAHGWLSFFLLGIITCTTPGGLQGLSLKGGAVPPGVYPTYHPLHQCSHPPSWGHIQWANKPLQCLPVFNSLAYSTRTNNFKIPQKSYVMYLYLLYLSAKYQGNI